MDFALFALLLCISAFFSASETALFSIGRVARARLEQSERGTDRLIAQLLESPRRLLVSVLLGNEITNVALSVVSASIISRLLPDLGVGGQALVSAAVVVPLLLFAGEVTPKTLAAVRTELIARIVAHPLALFARATAPVRSVLESLSDRLVARFGGAADDAPIIDEQGLRTLVDVGTEAGVVEDQERELINNVLDFGDLLVRDVMVPIDRVFSLDERTPVAEAIEGAIRHAYSRIPIFRRDPRNIVGLVYAKEMLATRWDVIPARPLRAMLRRPRFVLPTMPADDLLEQFRRQRMHMAVVVDEFGRAVGLCTLEDLLEELFGEITDTVAEAKGEDAPPQPQSGPVEITAHEIPVEPAPESDGAGQEEGA